MPDIRPIVYYIADILPHFNAPLLITVKIVAVHTSLVSIHEIFSQMIIGAGGPIAERAEKLACKRLVIRIKGFFLLPEFRIQVGIIGFAPDACNPLEVVESGGHDLDFIGVYPKDFSRIVLPHIYAMAESDALNPRVFIHSEDDPALRI